MGRTETKRIITQWNGRNLLTENRYGLSFRFTGKEQDSQFASANLLLSSSRTRTAGTPEETGLYYYGARYLDPRTSRWLSADPAMGEYIPGAPVNDEARKCNQNLPGMGGVFNYVNLHVYHYAGNNPVKYTDPDGEFLGIQHQLEIYYQRLGSSVSSTSDPYIMLQTVEQRDQNDLETGAFRDNALTIARDKFGLNSAEGNKYANNEQVRYESLMEIRQKGKADEVNKIVKDAEYVYNREKDNTIDYKDGKIIRLTPKEAAYRADQEANKIIDNYISSNDPSDPSYISPDSEISR